MGEESGECGVLQGLLTLQRSGLRVFRGRALGLGVQGSAGCAGGVQNFGDFKV